MVRRRQEALRYEFGTPLDTTFFISKVNGKSYKSKTAKGVVLNISPGGLRLQTALSLPEDSCELTFDVTIQEQTIQPEGVIMWKEKAGEVFTYGIDFTTEDHKDTIMKELKEYAKTHTKKR
ncbi:PilZ domain-containing protein [Paenalkalicoccus suaedae]|uniref:PilZ domain-containing protein n=1 Tax=Paenalkalicoccus suaedae TaxID=2592382 RepID=A0A859FJE3_9BACI|nr:PilZ domain-containing protein [Paenalkalicoccus suaedae]QKS72885.1 PilZ domain-containing protein [Paenalkalicoccus suaedae]